MNPTPADARLLPPDRSGLLTESRHPGSARLDAMTVEQAFDLINAEDATVPTAVAAARSEICRAVDCIADRLARGGRLFYVGAGTSGRLGVLDAAECPSTFLTDPAQIVGLIAGGPDAMFRSREGAEDRTDLAETAIADYQIGPRDAVFGIASGGTTPFVRGALQAARRCGAATIFFACVPPEQAPDEADISIRVLTGPEVLTGSTRMKAGTATKLVLNTISTLTMVRLGKVYQNLMVDLNAAGSAKLRDRAIRTLCQLTHLERAEAADLLDRAGGRVKTALVMHARGCTRDDADAALQAHDGHLSRVLNDAARGRS